MRNKVLWIIFNIFVFAVLNSATIVYVIGKFVPYDTIQDLKVSWIDYLKLSKKVPWYSIALIYTFMLLGASASWGYVKFLAWNMKENKKIEAMKEQNNHAKEVIIKQEEIVDEKTKRDIDKYL